MFLLCLGLYGLLKTYANNTKTRLVPFDEEKNFYEKEEMTMSCDCPDCPTCKCGNSFKNCTCAKQETDRLKEQERIRSLVLEKLLAESAVRVADLEGDRMISHPTPDEFEAACEAFYRTRKGTAYGGNLEEALRNALCAYEKIRNGGKGEG